MNAASGETEKTASAGATGARKGRVLRVKCGYNPNSSSLGSIVFVVPVSLIALPVVLNLAAAVILAMRPPRNGNAPAGKSKEARDDDRS